MNDIKVVFEDDYLLVLDKPPGLVIDSVADILREDFNITLFRGGIAHRLDKDTSGLLLVAKTQSTLENLQRQFKERKIKKEYLTLVHGLVNEGGVVEGAIARNPGNREKFMVLQEGKEAMTEYEPIEKLKVKSEKLKDWFPDFNNIQMRKLERQNYGQFTLVRCFPKTGRTHQIRVHLKYIRHPIVSDEKYVGRKMYRLDHRWCPRMFLHAKRIKFIHPVSGKWMDLESKLPEDLGKALETVR